MLLNTQKQQKIMMLVLAAADEGRFISMRELKSRYAPEVSNQAVLCSIGFLVRHGVVEKVYGETYGPFQRGALLYVKPTSLAYSLYRRRS
jgi:hypothetical protein